jgi:type II secretory pathway pseudopilin PulG
MWQDFVSWFQSPGGARVLQTAIIPALAILVAGVLAALIARSAVRSTTRRADRLEATSAIAALVAAARSAVDQEGDRGSRRASRLRTEADVRTRLLPLPGAGAAADWAAARTDALQQRSADGPVAAELDELRDRLVEWVERPARAKRIFTVDAAPEARAASPERAAEPTPGAAAPEAVRAEAVRTEAAVQREADQPEPERSSRQASEPGVRRTPAEPAAAPAADRPEVVAPAAASTVPVPSGSAESVPAWQRTRAGERLQQEHGRGRGPEAPTAGEDEPVPLSTEPVQLPHTHRAPAVAVAAAPEETEEAVPLEEHQQARHARPGEQTPASPVGPPPAATATPAPAWLDTYDDEAQVTQNLDLKTPPPVAAAAVRDRGGPGEDLVPRS